jgi:deoxyribonuclease V
MITSNQHQWNVTPEEAISIQHDLRKQVFVQNDFDKINLVAGIDVGYSKKGNKMSAAIVILTYPALELKTFVCSQQKVTFPYMTGLLSFREAPVILKAYERLKEIPDVMICDGHGIAHPRQFGLASHIGILTGIPTIGVAKKLLTGRHDPIPAKKGSIVPLLSNNHQIGAVLRTRTNVKPIYISVGHKISLSKAIEIVFGCTTGFRLPETTRWAHNLALKALDDSKKFPDAYFNNI